MPTFTGKLSIISNQSSLDSALLLMFGYSDTAQAMYQATQFLVKDRDLQSGQSIRVSGEQASVGTISIIVIRDAGPANTNSSGTKMKAALEPKNKKAKKDK